MNLAKVLLYFVLLLPQLAYQLFLLRLTNLHFFQSVHLIENHKIFDLVDNCTFPNLAVSVKRNTSNIKND